MSRCSAACALCGANLTRERGADKLPSVLLSGDASAALNHTLFRFVVHYMPEDGSVSSAQFADTLSARVKALSPIVSCDAATRKR